MSDTTADDRLMAEDINAYLAEHRNWGRWGHDDQLGALNLITAEKRRSSAAAVRTGRTVSLSRPLPTGPGPDNPHPARHFMQRFPRDPGGGVAVDFIGVNCHGLALTHVDALCHVWSESGMWNGRDPDEEISFDGAAFGGIEAWRDGIVTRGVLLDVPRYRGQPFVTFEEPVHGAELEAIAESQGVEIEPGDAVAVYCGREEWSRRHGPWGGMTGAGSLPSASDERPGLHASCLRFIRETDTAVLVWDMMDLTPYGLAIPWAVHAAAWAFGVALVDNALLEPLSHACEQEGRYEFQLVVAPLQIPGGTGSPVNPLAIL
ncbi:MAG: cyclase family protein [Acidimicrobiaceae bacterium]|nr:cyclase family protein [Acidimicrobiaceae bacterium]